MLTPFFLLRICSALCLIIAHTIPSQAQEASIGNRKSFIEYQSPNNGDTYVPERTTLIVRPNAAITRGRSAQDFSFTVLGESSGTHEGKVLISDDNETVIFKPNQPFMVNELVSVTFSIAGRENISPLSYSFRITSIDEQEQIRRLALFRQNQEKGNSIYPPTQASSPNDTILPSQFIVNIYAPDKVAPGNIYTTINGGIGVSSLEILDNRALPNFEKQIPHLPCEEFRPWQNKKYSYIDFGQVFLLDSNYAQIDNFVCGNGYQTDDHEFQLMPNGHVLLMANDSRDTDMRIITGDLNATSKGTVIGEIIQELDLQKNVVFQWRTWDHFEVGDIMHAKINDPNLRYVDYCHLNSIELDTDGNLLASFRAMDEVTKINRKNGKIIWRWGGKNSYFTFAGGDTSMKFISQHDVRRIANGNITMLDNGNYRTSIWGDGSSHDTTWSRAIEYELDEGNLTAKAVWQYGKIEYTSAAGNVQRLPNGNTFILSGPFGLQKAIEVTPKGEKVFQLSYPIGDFTYRAFRFPSSDSSSLLVRLPGTPNSFEFRAMYPNPAIDQTTVSFSVKDPGTMQIDLLDVLGHRVRSINERISESGTYSENLDVHGLAAGTYYCKLSQNGNAAIKMIVVQK